MLDSRILGLPLNVRLQVETALGEPPYRVFDAWFHSGQLVRKACAVPAQGGGDGVLPEDAAGSLMINGVPYDTAWAVRLGGHVLAGGWIVSSSLVCEAWPVRVIGVVTGLWLASYSFVADVLPESYLRPAGICILIWFALLAIYHRSAEERSTEAASPATV